MLAKTEAMTTYTFEMASQKFKVPCIILQETEDGVWIDLPQVPNIINAPCVQLVAKETLSEN